MDIQQIILSATEVAKEVALETAHEEGNGGVLGTLGIDWKLFLAQLVNFGIVLFVFWKWIVKPLGSTLTNRQQRIEDGLRNASYMETEKKKFEEWKINQMKKVRSEADNILRTTTDTANQIKQDTIFEAQQQANKLLDQARQNIQSEKIEMLKEVKQEVATLVVVASEKILRSKLDLKKDNELIKESMKEIK